MSRKGMVGVFDTWAVLGPRVRPVNATALIGRRWAATAVQAEAGQKAGVGFTKNARSEERALCKELKL